jgi:hypothetical protein
VSDPPVMHVVPESSGGVRTVVAIPLSIWAVETLLFVGIAVFVPITRLLLVPLLVIQPCGMGYGLSILARTRRRTHGTPHHASGLWLTATDLCYTDFRGRTQAVPGVRPT